MISNYSSVQILNCFFVNNTGANNGVLYFLFIFGKVTITNSLFKNNWALKGGAIYYENYDNCNGFILILLIFFYNLAKFNISIINCSLKLNKADYSGGAIQFTTITPSFDVVKLNSYYKNIAPYGKNYASFPVRLELKKSKSYPLIKNGKIIRVQPGIKMNYTLEFVFFDHFDQIVYLDYPE